MKVSGRKFVALIKEEREKEVNNIGKEIEHREQKEKENRGGNEILESRQKPKELDREKRTRENIIKKQRDNEKEIEDKKKKHKDRTS